MKRAPFKDLVESRHPLHISRLPFWRLAWSSYRGGPDYLAAPNLFSHRLEHGDDHRRRLTRSYYLNYCRPVVDTYASHILKNSPAILPMEPVRRLVENADGTGRNIYSFMKQALVLAAVYGQVMIGVDRPRSNVAPRTRADELSLGLSDYLHLVIPQNLLNWSTNVSGELAWCLICQKTRNMKPDAAKNGGDEVIYRLWTPESWKDIGEDGELIEEGENPFGRVPFAPCIFRETGDPVIGESLLASIANVNREIFNLSSMLSEILYRQTFSQLVAEGSAHEYGEGGDIGRLGTSSIFLYPEGRKAPGFINPDGGQAKLLMDQIDQLVDEIYRLASLSRGSAREAQLSSGISKAYDFLDTNQALSDAAQNLGTAFTRAIGIASPGWKGNIQFPGDFGVDDPQKLLEEVERSIAVGVGPVFRRRLIEKLARATLRELPAAQRDEVMEEIRQLAMNNKQ